MKKCKSNHKFERQRERQRETERQREREREWGEEGVLTDEQGVG